MHFQSSANDIRLFVHLVEGIDDLANDALIFMSDGMARMLLFLVVSGKGGQTSLNRSPNEKT